MALTQEQIDLMNAAIQADSEIKSDREQIEALSKIDLKGKWDLETNTLTSFPPYSNIITFKFIDQAPRKYPLYTPEMFLGMSASDFADSRSILDARDQLEVVDVMNQLKETI